MEKRKRADLLLVERGIFESRAKAQAAIVAGGVVADGIPVKKPSDTILSNAQLVATPAFRWVSRGGLKLEAALDDFAINPQDRVCLDIGASTGGFTEVLLVRGARHVTAVDVGHDQFHTSLRRHPRVSCREGRDIRDVTQADLPEAPSLIVIDVSFISLALVLPAAFALAAETSELVALIKPQFEAGRANLKKGVVRDATVQTDVCQRIEALTASLGWHVKGLIPSPIAGGDGNLEFLIAAERRP